jgi:hypothetical protein
MMSPNTGAFTYRSKLSDFLTKVNVEASKRMIEQTLMNERALKRLGG